MSKKVKYSHRLYLIARIFSLILILSSFLGLIYDTPETPDSKFGFIITQGLFMLIVSYVPAFAKKIWKIEIPIFIEVIFLLFCAASIILGEVFGFYVRFSWWDDVLHTINGVFVSIIGFVIINIWNERKNVNLNLSPAFVILFVFCFSETSALVWELFEWSVDSLFGTNMQRFKDNITSVPFSGRDALRDTIHDMALNTLGALITCAIGYYELKTRQIELD